MATLKYFCFLLLLSITHFYAAQENSNKKREWLPCIDSTGKWCFRSVDGKQLKGLYFDSATLFWNYPGNAVAIVMRNQQWGVIDTAGNYIIPLENDKVQYFSSGGPFFQVFKTDANGKKTEGLYNLQGALINPFKYCSCNEISQYDWRINDMRLVSSVRRRYVHLSRTSGDPRKLFECYYDKNQKQIEVVSETGKVLIDSSTYSRIIKDRNFVYLNDEGIVGSTHSTSFHLLEGFSGEKGINSRYVIETDKGLMLINSAGDTIVSPGKYDQYQKMSDGKNPVVLNVSKNDRWGLIDLDGQVKLQPKFDKALRYGGARVEGQIAEKTVIFDQWKKMDFGKYDSLIWPSSRVNRKYFVFKQNGKYGVLNEQGELIVPAAWDQIIESHGLYIGRNNVPWKPAVSSQSKMPVGADALYDHTGKVLTENTFETIHPLAHSGFLNMLGDSGAVYSISAGKYIQENILPVDNSGKYKYWTEYEKGVIKIFIKNEGWKIIDTLGNMIFPPTCSACQSVMLAFHSGQLRAAVYTQNELTPKKFYVRTSAEKVFKCSGARVEYRPQDDRFYVYGAGDTVVNIYSSKGKHLKTIRGRFAYMEEAKAYMVFYKSRDYRFYNLKFKPIFRKKFDRRHTYNRITSVMEKSGKYYVVNPGKKEISHEYDGFVYLEKLDILKKGKLTDIYRNDELLYAGCENFQEFRTYFTFQKDGKLYWINVNGEMYMVTDL